MTSVTSHEVGWGLCESRGTQLDAVLPDLALGDVSALLARLVEDRVPLALIADLANPDGPDSDQIMASEALDVG
ncbi:hypothetical protein [Sanguibacter suarezii]|uniref:hypothetical protein n=1 Tax=Sanguibacter suarezii TaxID=60921 RepID=UPI0008339D38|nr:hypothetical protein [Sanguibacter suarezii]